MIYTVTVKLQGASTEMREENRDKRRLQIEQAAYDLLAEKGYAGTTMLGVAKRARASNETLYRWYGDKQGLFLSLISKNAQEVKQLLGATVEVGTPPEQVLKALGPKLLSLLLGKRAITLNRAAASDASGELGKALAKSGRNTVLPMIRTVFAQMIAQSGATAFGAEAAADAYIGLLVADLQVRRVIGVLDLLDNDEIDARAGRAYDAIQWLMTRPQ